jgi:hypothetical protein
MIKRNQSRDMQLLLMTYAPLDLLGSSPWDPPDRSQGESMSGEGEEGRGEEGRGEEGDNKTPLNP